MDGWMDGWLMDGWVVNGWMVGWNQIYWPIHMIGTLFKNSLCPFHFFNCLYNVSINKM